MRTDDLIPVEYFHAAFTMPAEIARIYYRSKKALCAWATEALDWSAAAEINRRQLARDYANGRGRMIAEYLPSAANVKSAA